MLSRENWALFTFKCQIGLAEGFPAILYTIVHMWHCVDVSSVMLCSCRHCVDVSSVTLCSCRQCDVVSMSAVWRRVDVGSVTSCWCQQCDVVSMSAVWRCVDVSSVTLYNVGQEKSLYYEPQSGMYFSYDPATQTHHYHGRVSATKFSQLSHIIYNRSRSADMQPRKSHKPRKVMSVLTSHI